MTKIDTQAVTTCLTNWMLEFGIPVSIQTDGGPQFRSEFDTWCKEMGIKHELSSAYYPASNGHAEAGVKSMKLLLEKKTNQIGVRFVQRYFSSETYEIRNIHQTD